MIEMRKVKLCGISLLAALIVGITNVDALDVSSVDAFKDCISTSNTCKLTSDISMAETLTISKSTVIDLNGHTLSNITSKVAPFEVTGSLTINDSASDGKLIADYALSVDGGTLTLESGSIEVNKDYALYALNNGTLIIKGGIIDSLYAPLTGNNTTGAMNFEISGGTLTAKYGPAIYMPGPVGLKISGGTLNGGISLRMGQIDISGGTINAITSDIDSPASYYNYSGNAWFPDALYVYNGTYTTDVEGATNDLVLNITGGTFNVANGQGSAVAIYDLGKVEQKSIVNISGSAILKSDATSREAYQIVSFADMGVTAPKTGYNNAEYVGKVSTTISGGSYSTDVSKFVASGYLVNAVGGMFNVAARVIDVKVPVIDTTIPVEDITVGAVDSEVLISTVLEAFKDSDMYVEDKNIIVKVDISNQDSNDLSNEVIDNMDSELKNKYAEAKVVGYFDVTLSILDSDDGTVLGQLDELKNTIKLNVVLPEGLKNVAEGYTRHYYILRYHDGEIQILDANVDGDGNYLTFESDKFSTYALAYNDVKVETVVPKTGDEIATYLLIGAVSIAALVGALVFIKKNKMFN